LVKPDELSPDVWAPLAAGFGVVAEKARTAADGESAMKAYRQAYQAWLSAMIEAAASQARAVRDRANAAADPALKAFAAKMNGASTMLDGAVVAISNGDLGSAQALFNSATALIVEGLKALPAVIVPARDAEVVFRSPRRLFSLSESPGMLEIRDISASSPIDPVAGREERTFRSVREIEKQITTRDWLITFGVGVAAVVLGVFLLWVDNLTWGSVKDMITAVLWGLGLHQIAGNALFSKLDLASLEGQLTGVAAAGGAGGAH
jgi:hypothetical protein